MAYTMRKAGEKMEWMQRINRVMDYVEDHLRDDVDHGVSVSEFSESFRTGD